VTKPNNGARSAERTLRGVALFREVPEAALARIDARCHWQQHTTGQEIFGQQDEGNDVYFIVDGRVRVIVFALSGKEVTFRDLGAGESFGELAAIDGRPRSANVTALSDCLLARLDAAAFLAVLREQPEVAAAVMRQLAFHVRDLSDRVFAFSTLAVKNRIHAELLRLAREGEAEGNSATIAPAPTHAEIASRVSTHREAVTRELNSLARAGLLERRRGTLVLLDVARLERMVTDVLSA
jgi:CRP-like cAMP-binding protein